MRKRLIFPLIFITTLLPLSCFSDDNLESVMSPDGRWIAFTKNSDFPVPTNCFYALDKGEHGYEIWIKNTMTKKEWLLVKDYFSCHDVSKMIMDPTDLQFSPDSKTLYFETSAWVTSGAIHAVNVINGHERFVTDGGQYSVVMNGKYKVDLIVNQHRYHEGGGSYNWDWLFTPSGKQIKVYDKED